MQESKISNKSINVKKTKLMVAGGSNMNAKILLEGDEIEQMEDFKYLGWSTTKTTSDDAFGKSKKSRHC